MNDRRIFLAFTAFVALATIFGFGLWVGQPAEPVSSEATPVAVVTATGAPAAPVAAMEPGADATQASEPRIEVAEAAQMLGHMDALFLDVRSPESYASGHIEGAINLPETEINTRGAGLPKDKDIVLYCA